MIRLTRPDGSDILVNPQAIQSIVAATSLDPATSKSVAMIGGRRQALRETVAEVCSKLNQ